MPSRQADPAWSPQDGTASTAEPEDTLGEGIAPLALLSVICGVSIGLLGGAFRLGVAQATALVGALYASAHRLPVWEGFALTLVVIGALTLVPALMVARLAPSASGSGIHRVEAIWRREVPGTVERWFLLVKFIGGLLSLGAGYALGREGPIVQMGAVIGLRCAEYGRRSESDARSLIAGGAGAGLAVAFSAPLGGLLFALEELTKIATTRLVIVTMLACTSAVTVAQLLVGRAREFAPPVLAPEPPSALIAFFALGLLAGVLGALYNRAVMAGWTAFDALTSIPFAAKVLLAAVFFSLIVWFAPASSGNGEALAQHVLDCRFGASMLLLLLACRFILGSFSYSIGLPGGLFAPLIALGAVFGGLFGACAERYWPALGVDSPACAIVGMAALFAACIRAPLTGIVLILEMTGASGLLSALLVACLPAAIIPFWMKNPPIYETLRHSMLARADVAAIR